jgi:hypothetical protein
LNGPNGKANVRYSLSHILSCCIFCWYIMSSICWTFSLQPTQTRLWWKSDAFVGRWRNRTCVGNRTRLWNLTRLWVLHMYYMLFSESDRFMMWHYRLRFYIPWGAAEGNIYPKPGMSNLYTLSDSWITDI